VTVSTLEMKYANKHILSLNRLQCVWFSFVGTFKMKQILVFIWSCTVIMHVLSQCNRCYQVV